MFHRRAKYSMECQMFNGGAEYSTQMVKCATELLNIA